MYLLGSIDTEARFVTSLYDRHIFFYSLPVADVHSVTGFLYVETTVNRN